MSEESVEESLLALRGYARGHADYMGDEAFYPDEDEALGAIADRIQAALERERAVYWFCSKCGFYGTEVGDLTPKIKGTHPGCDYLAGPSAPLGARDRAAILKVAEDIERRVSNVSWGTQSRWAAELRRIAEGK